MARADNRNNPDSLEAEADRYLRKAGQDTMFPAYPEKYLISREERRGERSIEEMFSESEVAIPVVEALFDAAWCEILSGAHKMGLTIRQIEFLELRHTECTHSEIARITGWSRQTVQNDLQRAAVRIQKVPGFGLWTVLAEVFGCSVQRIRCMLIQK